MPEIAKEYFNADLKLNKNLPFDQEAIKYPIIRPPSMIPTIVIKSILLAKYGPVDIAEKTIAIKTMKKVKNIFFMLVANVPV